VGGGFRTGPWEGKEKLEPKKKKKKDTVFKTLVLKNLGKAKQGGGLASCIGRQEKGGEKKNTMCILIHGPSGVNTKKIDEKIK